MIEQINSFLYDNFGYYLVFLLAFLILGLIRESNKVFNNLPPHNKWRDRISDSIYEQPDNEISGRYSSSSCSSATSCSSSFSSYRSSPVRVGIKK